MSLWCMTTSPLFFSGDINRLDNFTLNILCNPEVIEVDQDPLGECASVVQLSDKTLLLVKKLEDGRKAVALFNRGADDAKITAKWSDVGVTGKQAVRDLWRQKDLGEFDGEFSATVGRHGVVLIRVAPHRQQAPRLPPVKTMALSCGEAASSRACISAASNSRLPAVAWQSFHLAVVNPAPPSEVT